MRQPRRRRLTGARRRGPYREHTSSSRWMHLSSKQVGDRHRIHMAWIDHAAAAHLASDIIIQLIILKILLLTNAVLLHVAPPNVQADVATDLLVQLATLEYGSYIDAVVVCFRLDHLLHDITPEELAPATYILRHQNLRLNSWDDRVARKMTGFETGELRRIYDLFGLAALGTGKRGCIPIPTGCHDSRGGVCRYLIHPEELFLFFMTRSYKGLSIQDMVDYIFGGYYNRWSYGWPWMIHYLDDRYQDIIGHQGLLRFRDDFPRFYAAIEQFMKRPKWHRINEDGEWVWSPGLAACPYRIFGFVDCSIYKICKPFSGPADGYLGAPRKRRFGIAQRAFYTGHRSRHGLKVETVFLPNGISTIYGPASCRRRDIGGGASVQDLSGLNRFLVLIQRGKPALTPPFAVGGDLIYGVNLECIRTNYKAYFRGPHYTEFMRVCDLEYTRCRIGHEWSYGKTENLFKICRNPDNFKLAKQHPYALELLRVCHLMVNIYNCLKGDASSSYARFDCDPPALEDYLRL